MTEENKINTLLDMLDTVQEGLLSLPDDMLLSIDPRDNESLDEGAQFIKEYNDVLGTFTQSTAKIAEMIKRHFDVNPEEDEVEKESANRGKRDRIIKELDRTESHFLGENFTYKRPYGFILGEAAYKGLKTWKNLYMHILRLLQEKDAEKFARLPREPKFISRRGNPLFSPNRDDLRVAGEFADGFFVEVNLSANHILKGIENLLEHFGIPPRNLKIYLREDRDAEN
ncbi:MAG: hypothetical protein RRC34_04840 [Lentisphaeria bacterium]|nr:hypothetical protein [Lentisphaeria bacterium]